MPRRVRPLFECRREQPEVAFDAAANRRGDALDDDIAGIRRQGLVQPLGGRSRPDLGDHLRGLGQRRQPLGITRQRPQAVEQAIRADPSLSQLPHLDADERTGHRCPRPVGVGRAGRGEQIPDPVGVGEVGRKAPAQRAGQQRRVPARQQRANPLHLGQLALAACDIAVQLGQHRAPQRRVPGTDRLPERAGDLVEGDHIGLGARDVAQFEPGDQPVPATDQLQYRIPPRHGRFDDLGREAEPFPAVVRPSDHIASRGQRGRQGGRIFAQPGAVHRLVDQSGTGGDRFGERQRDRQPGEHQRAQRVRRRKLRQAVSQRIDLLAILQRHLEAGRPGTHAQCRVGQQYAVRCGAPIGSRRLVGPPRLA
jgi:hypothetical protein